MRQGQQKFRRARKQRSERAAPSVDVLMLISDTENHSTLGELLSSHAWVQASVEAR